MWVEVDSKLLINLLSNNCKCKWRLHRSRPWGKMRWEISHIYGEGNAAADVLANVTIEIEAAGVKVAMGFLSGTYTDEVKMKYTRLT